MTIIEPPLAEIEKLLNFERLFKGRWRFNSALLSPMAYAQQKNALIEPLYKRLIAEMLAAQAWQPIVIFHKQDNITYFLVSLRQNFSAFYQTKEYADYFYCHGLGAEFTECLALFAQLKAGAKSRFSYGYPACPDLSGNKMAVELLEGAKYGITITENYQLIPEFSCCGYFGED